MHPWQLPYRQLYEQLCEYDESSTFVDLLLPWLAQNGAEIHWLAEMKSRLAPEMVMSREENWRLYALSRVVDRLTLPFTLQLTSSARLPISSGVTCEQLVEFMTRLGLEQHKIGPFHPFFHELVRVQSNPTVVRPEITAVLWPGFRLGTLLISRAGCAVTAAVTDLVPEIAQSSTLYWSLVRHNRPTADLSMGWGSNSQWRTAFRLDFERDGTLYYNVGTQSSADDEALNPGLNLEEKIELLRHRCFVRCAKAHDDWWPYDWNLVEPFRIEFDS